MAAIQERLVSLPMPLTRFIGRDQETAALVALLRDDAIRLVTLTGPGGVGKTRLALHAAERAGVHFADGAVFVPLAAVRDAEIVMPTVAQALGVRDAEGAPARDRVTAFFRDRTMLLVLDNLEQVLVVGPALREVLEDCPGITLLLTSRGPLRIPGERRFPVPPLPLPDPGAATAAIAGSEAVALFVDRAHAAAASFALTAENAADVAAICRRTDGLPLAIELAAARIRVLAPGDLFARLSSQLPLLSGGPRDQPARLRTMRDAIAWSHDLLSEDEQRLFRRLGVFVGGFTPEAAEWVTGSGCRVSETRPVSLDPGTRHPLPDTLETLASLGDKSLLLASVRGNDVRHAMLETVREFAAERLAASGEEEMVRDAHADWLIAFAERAAPELAGPDHVAWFNRIELEIGNVRAAAAWLFARGDAERALQLGVALAWFWQAAGYFQEGRALFTRFLAMPNAASFPELYAAALGTAGSIEHQLGDLERARALVERALRFAEERGDERAAIAEMRTLGSIAVDRGDYLAAERLLNDVAAKGTGLGAIWEAVSAGYLLGTIAFARGEFAAAMRYARTARDRWQDLGDTGNAGAAQIALARATLAAGNADRAATFGHEVLSQLHDVEDDAITADCLELAAGLAWTSRDAMHAARLLGAADAMRGRIGTPRRAGYQVWFEQLRDALRGCGEASFIRHWAAGEALSVGEATAAAFAAFARVTEPSRRAATDSAAAVLTTREREVLRLLVHGLSDKEIAATLGISRHTAANHAARIRAKLGASSRASAVVTALRDGLAEA